MQRNYKCMHKYCLLRSPSTNSTEDLKRFFFFFFFFCWTCLSPLSNFSCSIFDTFQVQMALKHGTRRSSSTLGQMSVVMSSAYKNVQLETGDFRFWHISKYFVLFLCFLYISGSKFCCIVCESIVILVQRDWFQVGGVVSAYFSELSFKTDTQTKSGRVYTYAQKEMHL